MSEPRRHVRGVGLEDIDSIAAIHTTAMIELIGQITDNPAEVVDTEQIKRGWTESVRGGHSDHQGILVAVEENIQVGFLAFASAPEVIADEKIVIAAGIEILTLEVDGPHRHNGHASRLLSACADHCSRIHASTMRMWLPTIDEAKVRFFQQAGFAPSGFRRQLAVEDQQMTEHLWFATLSDHE